MVSDSLHQKVDLLYIRLRLKVVILNQITIRINPVMKNNIVLDGSGISVKGFAIGSGLKNKNIRMIAQTPQT